MLFVSSVARKVARWGGVFSLLALGGIGEAEAHSPYRGVRRQEPRTISYRHADDTFAHQISGVAGAPKRREGDLSYHGNRLNQYQFIGPAGQGGIYDALKNYKSRRPLDAANYQYRW